MDICLLITTCQHYFSNIPNLIKDIEECNFPKENVLIVSGQEKENSIYYENNVKIVKVPYTGLHLTGVIYVSENIDLFPNIKYWVILPDTIKLNKLFYVNIMKYYDTYLKNKEIYSLPFIHQSIRPTMDMGIIHSKHIYNMSDYLNKIKKEQPYDINDIFRLKIQLIYNENAILGLPSVWQPPYAITFNYMDSLWPEPKSFIVNDASQIIEKQIVINNKICNEVYFADIDMYKYQRNFNGPYAQLVMEL